MGLRSNTVTEAVTPLPTIEALIEGKGAEAAPTEAPKVEPKEETSQLDRIEREQKHRRELFALQKQNKELEQKYRDSSNKTSILDDKNPIKALAKSRGLTTDEVVKMALDAMDDDQSDAEKKDDLKNMTPEAIAKLVKEELDKEKQKESEGEKQSQAIKEFKESISVKSKELAEKYPMVDALGGNELAFKAINDKFIKDSEEYGQEYAQENMMSIEDAIKSTNETLANNVKVALQSKHLRDFILKAIKDDALKDKVPSQSEDADEQLKDEAVTITNNGHRAGTEPAGKPKFNSDQDELDYLINNYI